MECPLHQSIIQLLPVGTFSIIPVKFSISFHLLKIFMGTQLAQLPREFPSTAVPRSSFLV